MSSTLEEIIEEPIKGEIEQLETLSENIVDKRLGDCRRTLHAHWYAVVLPAPERWRRESGEISAVLVQLELPKPFAEIDCRELCRRAYPAEDIFGRNQWVYVVVYVLVDATVVATHADAFVGLRDAHQR